ncbi:septal ring lytic transglycosylase RlpA family protein [Zavarzinia aquatilis]|uniref:Endolytic peptidoglycan transglycosylase RlpA n=1 Tax=Zavarzinia aquatilis TaxID=2211142 RepID=A0A317EKE8_9PROT|nr:septal ring lytic transglycosylase RlpA family protein [Zavarzinia aquatilis]PWR25903.1 septal ring lytic transglycosylase RlpA family protein [Zavarzinia aquatilis]
MIPARSSLRTFVVVTALAATLGACARDRVDSNQTTRPGVVEATLRPYQIKGVWYYPKVDWSYDETGIASWYGEPFHGRKTAIGEVYDMNEMTAAHKTLQLPADVRVTNLENGRSVMVRVNDRGPFVNDRIIDLSRRAAQLLGFQNQGTARVRVQVVDESGRPGVSTLPVPQTTPEERTAAAAAPVGTVTAAPLAPPPGARGVAGTPARPATPAPAVTPASAVPATPPPAVYTQGPVRQTGIYIQAGAFLQPANAYRLQTKLSRYGKAFIARAFIDGQQFYRVRVGPMPSVDAADAALDQIIASGETGARIVVE